ncbi:MAG TPA: tetratricopeptide repeat protein [Candidatus Edwardsbacteria bacterium]|nr:tetratricopeptide repeat protein [Candidatus Edwardsbacteria bacterium]
MTPSTEERRLITILFADLSGFTALSSGRDPEEVREAVNISFEHINKPIAAEQGTIIKYEGDLVMAVFGHPTAHEDDPERAVRAALGMFGRMDAVNRDLASRLKTDSRVGLHIGINSGTVVVGEIGSDEKRERTVMGEAVNLASRLKDAAQTGEILVSEPVFRATRYLVEYQPKPKVSAKGFDHPIAVFRPVKLRDKPEPKRGIAGLTSPMVGRDRELAELLDDARTLARGAGGATFVVGEAGLGKSRLLAELKSAIAAQGIAVDVMEGRCLAYGRHAPYWPLLQALQAACGLSDETEPAMALESIVSHCHELLPDDWMDTAPYLAHLYSLALPHEMAEKVVHLDAKALKARTHLGLRKFLQALAARAPLLLVVDDYHWVDESTDEFLRELCELPALPLRLLALTRPESDAGGQQARQRFQDALAARYREIALAPLDSAAGTSLAFNLLSVPGIGQGFKDMLLAKSGGNPFYLEEIIRSLIDSGVLTYRNGVWRLTEDVSSLSIPDTVQSVIAARLDRLERDLRDILQTASVLGRSFHVHLLEALSGLDDMMLNLYLATLEEFDFIAETKRGPEAEYAFRHPLSQEVAYQALLKKRRRELHRMAGQAIERAYAERLDDFAEVLAHHYANSDDEAKAIEWLWRAGRKARERYANQEAIAFFTTLADTLKWLPQREPDLYEACAALGDAYTRTSDLDESASWYKRMEQHAGNDAVRQARARRLQADILQQQGRYGEALELLAAAERPLTARSDAELLEQAEVRNLRSWILRIKGDTAGAVREGEAALRILEADLAGSARGGLKAPVAKARIKVLNSLGGIHYVQGELDRAIRLFQAVVDISAEAGELPLLMSGQCNLGVMHYSKGDPAKAMEYYQRFLDTGLRIGDKKAVATAYGNMAIVHQEQGEYGLALERFQKALDINQEVGDRMAVAMNFGNMGLVYKSQGDYARAEELFTAYRDTSREIGYKQGIGVASLNLANLYHHHRGDAARAEALLREIEPLFTELGDKASLCEMYMGWADLKGEMAGGLPEAMQLADKARALAEEVGSQVWQGQVEWTYGNLMAAAGKPRESGQYFEKAMAVFEATGRRQYLADLCRDYAKMLRGTPDGAARADALLARARDLYTALGLTDKAAECR